MRVKVVYLSETISKTRRRGGAARRSGAGCLQRGRRPSLEQFAGALTSVFIEHESAALNCAIGVGVAHRKITFSPNAGGARDLIAGARLDHQAR